MFSVCYFDIFCPQFVFLTSYFLSVYKELLEPISENFEACLMVMNNLWEVFGCSVITDFCQQPLGYQTFLVVE